jgi:hypothetical protein
MIPMNRKDFGENPEALRTLENLERPKFPGKPGDSIVPESSKSPDKLEIL